ncbi:type II toxin-antitoxin system PemK/MazF family toxin [candidate division NPL-UPA2 bacterium]|nr:type II toxin-antitoxin system PemK/MazF family toxin [candidate division NPL-UPA2 bacterium]
MKRGEVWWADLPKPIGRRPVVLLSRDEAYKVRNAVTVAEITRIRRDIPVEVPLGEEDGLPKKCVVNLDTIITMRKLFLKERVCLLKQEKINAINKAIKFALALG